MASLERSSMTIQSLEEAFKKLFDVNSVQFKYKMSNGNVQGIYQDFHLENALADCANSGARFLELQLTASGAPAQSSPSPSKPTSSPATPKPVTPSSSTSYRIVSFQLFFIFYFLFIFIFYFLRALIIFQ